MAEDGKVVFENAKIIFRNFAGNEGMYNRKGDRNFNVVLPEDVAEAMLADGWNVKRLKPRDDDAEVGDPVLEVAVSFKGRPPNVYMITSRGRTRLGEDEVELLDWADIKTVDLIVRPYQWTVNGKSGIKAYLFSMFATIEEDYLDLKYADVPDAQTPKAGLEEDPPF